MKFNKFLADRKFSILCYILFMIFISLVIYLDGSVKVSIANILYINLVSTSFFIIYLISRYIYYRSYYKSLYDIVEHKRDEIINRLPKVKSYEHVLFHEVLSSLYNEGSSKVQKFYEQKKDYEEFITSWVHQVKTPIAVSRLLIENDSNSLNKDTLRSLEEEIDKIENYIEQALYYSKIDNFSKDYLINQVDLDRLIKESVKKQAKTFINKKINIEIDNIDLEVTTDKKWISFIVDQVLSNALKYTSPGGKIRIYRLVEDKSKKLIIEDNGIGVKEEDLHRVFDKGFTGANGRENYRSTGFGLYLSKRLARKLGHDITMESKYGEYTKVIIAFPKLLDYLQVSKE
ncbi:sensor histidine kinase [Clostridium sp.]|uniref:sensor histidine kinase n=1 Tax=Clostridium sp. TaxID=1506 RepID=UPI002FC5941C